MCQLENASVDSGVQRVKYSVQVIGKTRDILHQYTKRINKPSVTQRKHIHITRLKQEEKQTHVPD